MDFSGRTGRVIDNPVEAQSAALEEGQTWRVRGGMKLGLWDGKKSESKYKQIKAPIV